MGSQDPIDKKAIAVDIEPRGPTQWGRTTPLSSKTLWKEFIYMSEDAPLTISVPEAGKKYFGLCRNASYDAAARGELPVIRIGRLLRVPVRALERMLDRGSDEPTA